MEKIIGWSANSRLCRLHKMNNGFFSHTPPSNKFYKEGCFDPSAKSTQAEKSDIMLGVVLLRNVVKTEQMPSDNSSGVPKGKFEHYLITQTASEYIPRSKSCLVRKHRTNITWIGYFWKNIMRNQTWFLTCICEYSWLCLITWKTRSQKQLVCAKILAHSLASSNPLCGNGKKHAMTRDLAQRFSVYLFCFCLPHETLNRIHRNDIHTSSTRTNTVTTNCCHSPHSN